jgi:hypothetical protein
MKQPRYNLSPYIPHNQAVQNACPDHQLVNAEKQCFGKFDAKLTNKTTILDSSLGHYNAIDRRNISTTKKNKS